MKTFKTKLGMAYNADCFEVMKMLPNGCVDMILADLPYGIDLAEWDVTHSNTNSALGKQDHASFKRRGKPLNGWSSKDKENGKEYFEFCKKFTDEFFRLTKEASPIIMFSSRRLLHKMTEACEQSGFIVKDVLIWKKDKAHSKAQRVLNIPAIKKSGLEFPNMRVGNLKPMFEPMIYAFKPYSHTLAKCIIETGLGGFNSFGTDVIANIFESVSDRGLHPTQKPLSLIETIIKTFTNENHFVFDPTAGSLTTGVAAENLNRHWICVEQIEEYFNKGIERFSK